MKSPRRLSRIFEREIKIKEGSVVFACEWGVSSCQGLLALRHLQTCQLLDEEGNQVEPDFNQFKNLKLLNYDGSFVDYQQQIKKSNL